MWSGISVLFLELGMAFLSGALIGFQRGARGKAAGVKTHVLICVGAAIYMQVSNLLGVMSFGANPAHPFDAGRIAAQVVTGVGFIGAGTIIRSGLSVAGLTSAATIWVVAALGLASGSSMWTVWAVGTVICTITLEFGRLPIKALRRTRAFQIAFATADAMENYCKKLSAEGADVDLVGFRRELAGRFEAHLRIRWAEQSPTLT